MTHPLNEIYIDGLRDNDQNAHCHDMITCTSGGVSGPVTLTSRNIAPSVAVLTDVTHGNNEEGVRFCTMRKSYLLFAAIYRVTELATHISRHNSDALLRGAS